MMSLRWQRPLKVLWACVIDFGFERELPMIGGEKVLSSGIKVSDERPNKKSKADHPSSQRQVIGGSEEDNSKCDQTKDNDDGKQKQQVYWSAPPNIDFKRKSQTKMMADAQKSYNSPSCEADNEKVHIPETFEDSDSNSDSFGLKVQMLTGMGDAGQSTSRKECEGANKQLWFVETQFQDNVIKKIQEGADDGLPGNTAMEMDEVKTDDTSLNITTGNTLSPEIFLSDDAIINTRECRDSGGAARKSG